MNYDFSKIDWERQSTPDLVIMHFAVKQLRNVMRFSAKEAMEDFKHLLSTFEQLISDELYKRGYKGL